MSLHCLCFVLLGSVLSAWPGLAGAQTMKARPTTRPAAAPPVDTTQVYTYVEQMPQPPGGMEGLMQYLGKNFKYPHHYLEMRPTTDIPSRIMVRFVVRRNGHITDVVAQKSGLPAFDEEAVRVISRMPPWQPGRQNGQPVNVSYTVPITIEVR